MNRIILITSFVFIMSIILPAQIVVKQDKHGRIIVSNIYSGPDFFKKSKRLSSKNSSQVPSIPSRYLSKIKKLSQKYGIKESLILAVARAESGFNPFAVSRKGAVGIMQLMPETAQKYGVLNRYNAFQNLEAGVEHLKYLFKKYKKNLPLTLAAYNAGEEAVKKHRGIPPFKETRIYIKRVMKYMGLGYSNYFKTRVRQKIYKIVSNDGKITITDQLPSKVNGHVSIID